MGFFSSIFGKSKKTKEGEAKYDFKVKELLANPADNGLSLLEEIKTEYNLHPDSCKKLLPIILMLW